jgi:hypothetical protein
LHYRSLYPALKNSRAARGHAIREQDHGTVTLGDLRTVREGSQPLVVVPPAPTRDLSASTRRYQTSSWSANTPEMASNTQTPTNNDPRQTEIPIQLTTSQPEQRRQNQRPNRTPSTTAASAPVAHSRHSTACTTSTAVTEIGRSTQPDTILLHDCRTQQSTTGTCSRTMRLQRPLIIATLEQHRHHQPQGHRLYRHHPEPDTSHATLIKHTIGRHTSIGHKTRTVTR